MLNWYRRIFAQELSKPKPGDTYMNYGHDSYEGYVQEEDWNPEDAIWAFLNGFHAVTLGEWIGSGKDARKFEHVNVFESDVEIKIKGRYDANQNTVSFVNHGQFDRVPSIFIRQIEQRWPGAKIIDFSPWSR